MSPTPITINNEHSLIKPVTVEQAFHDNFSSDQFYFLVCRQHCQFFPVTSTLYCASSSTSAVVIEKIGKVELLFVELLAK
jgi:hypothetical protein